MNTIQQKKQLGTLVISLDFELYWGVRDTISLADYRQRVLGVYRAVPAILELFKKYQISATWATVGFLYYQNVEQLKQNLPQKIPSYLNTELSPYPYIQENSAVIENQLHFSHQLIDLIGQSPNQEIGTHTFSHYYCLEEGQTKTEFKADLDSAIAVAEKKAIATKSLVFPRNQYNQSYLDVLKDVGIESYRGNETSSIYNSIDGDGEKLTKKILRFLDSYLNVSGYNCYSFEELMRNYPINIPSSRFLRPYSAKLRHFETLRLHRITSALNHAAKNHLIYHLWWHPHNFGLNLAENLQFLEKILEHYQKLNQQGKMRSLNMQELTKILTEITRNREKSVV